MNDKQKIAKLRKVLIDLIGAETKEELDRMERFVRTKPGVKAIKELTINAIHALMETADTEKGSSNGLQKEKRKGKRPADRY